MLQKRQRGLSYAQIGAIYGITRQRVFQIVKRDKGKLTGNNSPRFNKVLRFCVGLIGWIKQWKL